MLKVQQFTLFCFILIMTGCHGGMIKGEAQSDSLFIDETLPLLVGDSSMNKAAQFYAGISKEGIKMNVYDEQAWNNYKLNMDFMMKGVHHTLHLVDSIMATDMSDLREETDFVFYPFAGADFLYPITLFPHADTYFLMGLEQPGSALGEVVTNFSKYESYRRALSFYLQSSYFITKDMMVDLNNQDIDGVVPLISMLMAMEGFEIQKIRYVKFDLQGSIQDSTKNSNMVEINFFRSGSYHLQKLYFLSGNVIDTAYNPLLEKYQERFLKNKNVTTYIKAASYLMHMDAFSKIRNQILKFSKAIIQDDSGIPVRFLKDDWNLSLYGIYTKPLSVFGPYAFQYDLMNMYNQGKVHNLPFHIGYNYPSNWLCARKK